MDLETVVFCDCGSLDHLFRFRWSSYPEDLCDDELWLEVHITDWPYFWRRLWRGLKYIFGYKSRFGSNDCVQVSRKDAARMVEVLQVFLAAPARPEAKP